TARRRAPDGYTPPVRGCLAFTDTFPHTPDHVGERAGQERCDERAGCTCEQQPAVRASQDTGLRSEHRHVQPDEQAGVLLLEEGPGPDRADAQACEEGRPGVPRGAEPALEREPAL